MIHLIEVARSLSVIFNVFSPCGDRLRAVVLSFFKLNVGMLVLFLMIIQTRVTPNVYSRQEQLEILTESEMAGPKLSGLKQKHFYSKSIEKGRIWNNIVKYSKKIAGQINAHCRFSIIDCCHLAYFVSLLAS